MMYGTWNHPRRKYKERLSFHNETTRTLHLRPRVVFVGPTYLCLWSVGILYIMIVVILARNSNTWSTHTPVGAESVSKTRRFESIFGLEMLATHCYRLQA